MLSWRYLYQQAVVLLIPSHRLSELLQHQRLIVGGFEYCRTGVLPRAISELVEYLRIAMEVLVEKPVVFLIDLLGASKQVVPNCGSQLGTVPDGVGGVQCQ